MATVQANCPACGEDVKLGPQAVSLYPTGERPFYAFVCPSCGVSAEKPANDKIIRLLTQAGVNVVRDPTYPEEIEHPELGPITLDEIIDFHFALEEAP